MTDFEKEIRALVDKVYAGEKKALVFGEGPKHARLMLIGEAPGRQEALTGRPFVGAAGKNLDYFIEATGLDRGQMYVTNTVKFRPSKISPAGNTVNRPPTTEEIALFTPFVLREIEDVDPDMVVTLGNVPLRAVAGAGMTVGALHGQLIRAAGRHVFPMYHPAAVIYNPALKDVFMADMAALAHLMKTDPKIN